MPAAIRVDETPNPNAIKLTADKSLFEGTKSISVKNGETVEHPLLSELLKIEGIDNIFGFQDFITINKTPDADWETLLPQVEEAFKSVE
jgi:hypothetical protein